MSQPARLAAAPVSRADYDQREVAADLRAVRADLRQSRPRPVAAINPLRPPTRLSIPAIGVGAPVESVPFLGLPSSASTVAWFQTSSAPGEPGDAVFDGHLDWPCLGCPAIFWNLNKLNAGDEILVGGGNASLRFVVDTMQLVPYDGTPPEWLYTSSGPPHITLITCAGAWISSQHTYTDRLLVRAKLAA